MKKIFLLAALALSGCVNGAINVPGYTVSATAVTLGPIGLGALSLSVQPHVDQFGKPLPTPTP